MPRQLRIIVIVLGVLLLVGFGYLLFSSDESSENTSLETQTSTPANSEPPEQTDDTEARTTASGSYVAYSAEAVASANGQKVLFFHAPWCPQCRQLDKSITEGVVPAGVTIYKVDYDSNQELRQRYGVTIQTTLVLLDKDGNEAKKYVAYDEPNLTAVVDNLL